MANRTLTEKQSEFCLHIANGKSNIDAYTIAYGVENTSGARVNATKLMKRSDIQEQIRLFQEINKNLIDAANEIAAKNIAEGSIADKVERMQILTEITRGERKIPNTKFFFDSKTGSVVSHEVEELPDHAAQIKAIAELNKMAGDYAPSKQDITTNGKDLPQTTIQIGYGPKRKD